MNILLYIAGPVFFIYLFIKIFRYFNKPINEDDHHIDLYSDEYEDFI